MSKKHYGPRVEEDCIDSIVQHLYDFPSAQLEHIFQDVSPHFNNISTRTLRRWYDHYIEWGEYPHESRSKKMAWGKKCKKFKRTSIVNNDVITALQDIINEAPELYLEKIAEELGKATSVYLPHNTIHYVLHHRLNYTLQVCYESAKQQDETE